MKKISKKKLMIFGKSIPMFVIVLMGLVLVSGALLSYYGFVRSNVTVTQPISFWVDTTEYTGTAFTENVDCDAGETCISSHKYTVKNDASEDRTVKLTPSGGFLTVGDINYVGRLELDNKDPSTWIRISDSREGELYYFITGDEFGYHFEAQGLNDVEYALIYYADDTDRFNVWGGSPAVLIDSGIASSGALTLEGSTPIGDLPFATDWNIDGTPNYCNLNNGFDDFEHCYGAKIWLVPMSDYDVSGQTVYPNWDPTEWLFETDLIYYFDNTNGEYTIGANSFVEFYPLFSVDGMAGDGTYTVDTEIQPVI